MKSLKTNISKLSFLFIVCAVLISCSKHNTQEPCCYDPIKSANPTVKILTETTSLALSPGVRASLDLSVVNITTSDIEISVNLDTTEGANWKVALCHGDDCCVVHDGINTLEYLTSIAANSTEEFAVKFIVPPAASINEYKMLSIKVIDKATTYTDYITIKGEIK